jgi:hypothetical protein
VSRHQNVGQNHNLLIANKFFENVAMFKYLGIANKPKLGAHSFRRMLAVILLSLLSFRLLRRNLMIKIYKIITLPVVLMGVKIGLSHQGKKMD